MAERSICFRQSGKAAKTPPAPRLGGAGFFRYCLAMPSVKTAGFLDSLEEAFQGGGLRRPPGRGFLAPAAGRQGLFRRSLAACLRLLILGGPGFSAAALEDFSAAHAVCAAERAPSAEPAKRVVLSQEYVIKQALSQSRFIARLKARRRQARAELRFQRLAPYSYKLFSSAGHQSKKNLMLSPFESKEEKSRLYSFGLEKKLPFGLSLKSAYSDSFRGSENSRLLRRFQAPGEIYKKKLSLELSIDLLPNFFGLEERRFLAQIDSGSRIAEWRHLEEAESLALKAAGQYWKARIARAAYQQADSGLQTYSRLRRQIREKQKKSFLRPGEGPQVFAGYERASQELDQKKQDYQDELCRLFVLLKIQPAPGAAAFAPAEPEPEAPAALGPAHAESLESLRPVRILAETVKERELAWKTSRSALWPSLRLQTKAGWLSGGAEPPRSGFLDGRKPFYELSLSFLYPVFSKAAREKSRSEKSGLEEAQISLEIFKAEMGRKISLLNSKIPLSRSSLKRSEKARHHQREAFLELQRAFAQGRTGVFELMRAEGKLREAEVRLEMARSRRALLALERAALLDQLAESYL